ncbi:Peptidase S28 [Moelleriella libera RCEF 2490]|uniref:Peptidase S28 n=1 Tax=Moelleriella libera RCEF 2490 TaxID=1081109 RepID=A0A166V2J7_9HYPO|nr:Peptidase S28 [Moelleriella libera RCEF 2490]
MRLALVCATGIAALCRIVGAVTANSLAFLPPILDDEFAVSAVDPKKNVKAATFQQLIDHKNPSLGTFTQRYWYNDEFYKGPGSPIVLNAPGEFAADNYLGYTKNVTLQGVFAQTNGGAVILLEHRYWGGSSPYQNLTVETLQYLTLDQAVQDLVHFAKTVRLPFDPQGSSKPDKAPWILSGCSYPGALTAWTNVLAPGTFWAYHCSSAVVQSVTEYWQYYQPIDLALAKNCSADLKRINRHVQKVLTTKPEKVKAELKSRFGLAGLQDDDFAAAVINPVFMWQGQQFYSGYRGTFRMCDYLEGFWPDSNATRAPGPEGVGLDKGLNGFTKYWREVFLLEAGACDDNTTSCYDTHNTTSRVYQDTSVRNPYNRQWEWFVCNEAFEWWPVGSFKSFVGYPAPLVNVNYWRRQCPLFFPELAGKKVGMSRGVTAANVNARTGGWSFVNTTRLIWINGEYDPWRTATVSSDFRPGGPFRGDKDRPVMVIPKASHCSDLIMKNAAANEGVRKVVDAEVAKMKEWVAEFYKK